MRVGLHAGMLAAALGGLDAFVFAAGIGENSAIICARIAQKLAWLGAVFDPAANAAGKILISRPQSRIAVYVVPPDEELMIARHTLSLLSRREATGVVGETIAGSSPAPIRPRIVDGSINDRRARRRPRLKAVRRQRRGVNPICGDKARP